MSWIKLPFLMFSCLFVSYSFGQEKKYASDFIKISKEVSFGKIKIGETKRIVIGIKNISNELVALEHFTNNCTCLNVVHLNQKGIKPLAQDSIVILYKPSRYGYVEENILLYVKGVENPLFCKLKGRVLLNN